ncbi:hypothetical protein HZ994_07515 [Akkermansiaceae bacterium]|nr:hypothetical protein HZ994_07515 [Akkermansiaceae bacterium]
MPKKPSPTAAILGILLVCATVTQFVGALSWGHESYQITDWLINYAGGFVRRGLPGTLLGFLEEVTGIGANLLAIAVSLALYLSLAAWFLRRGAAVFPAALILSCIVMGFPGYQDFVRKDCLGLLLLLGCLKAQDSGLPGFPRAVIANLLAALAILSHETFMFYALPALVFMGKRRPGLREVSLGALSLAPAALVFLIVAKHHGTPAIAAAVHESWMPLWKTLAPGEAAIEPAASIAALGWTAGEGLHQSGYMLTSGLYQPLCWISVFSISFLLVILFTGCRAESSIRTETRVRVTALLVAQLVFISPLFLLGIDYGRWLFLWVASSLMLHLCGRRPPAWLEAAVAGIFRRLKIPAILERIPARDWYLLFFGFPVIWNLHNFITASPVVRHLELLRTYF